MFSFGFYDAIDNDRVYSATQFGEMFDGLITDGVYATIGNAFAVVSGEGVQVKVKSGRAWFNKRWTVNTADIPLDLELPDLLLPRIDAVILEVDTRVAVRSNAIRIITGTPSINPSKPVLTRSDGLYQYPLAWVRVDPNVEVIASSKIENNVGLDPTPFVTGILKSISIDDLWNQWEGQFDEWFANVQAQLEGDIALNLQNQINALKSSKVNVSDKATAEQITSGTPNKWVDAAALVSYTDQKLLPKTGEIGFKPTKYPLKGQILSKSEHQNLFNVIGYGDGIEIKPMAYVYSEPQNFLRFGLDIKTCALYMCELFKIQKIQPSQINNISAATKYIMSPMINSKFGTFFSSSQSIGTYSTRHPYFTIATYGGKIDDKFASGLRIIEDRFVYRNLGETENNAIYVGCSASEQNLYFCIANKKVSDLSYLNIGELLLTDVTTTDAFDSTSPCIKNGVMKYALISVKNNQMVINLITATNYNGTTQNSASISKTVINVPLSGSYTDASLKQGIGRNIVLNGVVYIHAVDTSNNLTLIAFDLFTQNFSTVTGQTKTLITSWTAKHAPYSFYRISYNSYATTAIGAIECKEDGSDVELEILYIENSVLKLYSQHTYVAESASKPSEISLYQNRTTYAGSDKVAYIDDCRSYIDTPDRYCASLLFQNGNPIIVLNRIGYSTYRPLLGVTRVKLDAPLRPLQLYLNSISLTGRMLYNINDPQGGTHGYVRCGDNNEISFVVLSISKFYEEKSGNTITGYNASVYTNFGIVTQDESKFRIADAYGAPLYYGE